MSEPITCTCGANEHDPVNHELDCPVYLAFVKTDPEPDVREGS